MKKIIFSIIFLLFTASLSFAEIPIYCPHCKEHLYNYQKPEIIKGTKLLAKDFKPAQKDIPQPEEDSPMVCPLCDSPLNGYEWFTWERGMSPPVFHFPAVTLLTKDEEGNFKFVPWVLDLSIEGDIK